MQPACTLKQPLNLQPLNFQPLNPHFQVLLRRRIDFKYVKDLPLWPRWAEPDNGAVFFFIILPFYAIYYFIFPFVWCACPKASPPPLLPSHHTAAGTSSGTSYTRSSCFPSAASPTAGCMPSPTPSSSRTKALSLPPSPPTPHPHPVSPPSGFEHPFDSSDAIILPMVQKGKLEETILEAVPQMAVQIVNSYWSSSPASVITILSISFSALSLLNTIWFYAYWQFYQCKRTRDVPSPLALYNYKLEGVRDGIYSFSKPQKEVARADAISFNPSVLPNSRTLDNALSKEKEKTVVREGEVAIELMVRPLSAVLFEVGDDLHHEGKAKAVEVELPPRVKAGGGGGVFEGSDDDAAADAIANAVAATRAQCEREAAAERAALQAEVDRLKQYQQQQLPHLNLQQQNQQQQQQHRSRAASAAEGSAALELQRHQADQEVRVM